MADLVEKQMFQEQFVERGLGTSPLASRAIRQRDIQDLRNLRAQVMEAQTRSERESRERALQTLQRSLRSSGTIRGGGAGSAGGGALGVISRTPSGKYHIQLNVQPGSGTGLYLVRGTEEFSDIDEVEAFFKRNPELLGRLAMPVTTDVERRIAPKYLERFGVSVVSGTQARQILGRTAIPQGFPSFKAPSRQTKTPQMPISEVAEKFKANEAVASNVKARMIDYGYQKVREAARVGGTDRLAEWALIRESVAEGKGEEALRSLMIDNKISF